MANNLRKGSKVFVTLKFPGERKEINRTKLVPGIVVKRLTVKKGSVNVDPKNPEARTLVKVRRVGERTVSFTKRPSELKRRK